MPPRGWMSCTCFLKPKSLIDEPFGFTNPILSWLQTVFHGQAGAPVRPEHQSSDHKQTCRNSLVATVIVLNCVVFESFHNCVFLFQRMDSRKSQLFQVLRCRACRARKQRQVPPAPKPDEAFDANAHRMVDLILRSLTSGEVDLYTIIVLSCLGEKDLGFVGEE